MQELEKIKQEHHEKEKTYEEGEKKLREELLAKEKEHQEEEKKLREELLVKDEKYMQEVFKLKEELLCKSVELSQSQLTLSYLMSQIPDDKKNEELTKSMIEWSASVPSKGK